MEYSILYDANQSSLPYGVWFSTIIGLILVLVAVILFVKKPLLQPQSSSKTFLISWSLGVISVVTITLGFLWSSYFETRSAIKNSSFKQTVGEVTNFHFFKRDTRLAEFTLSNGISFETDGLGNKLPRIGLPTGTSVRVSYLEPSKTIVRLEIESTQFSKILEASRQAQLRCINFGECNSN